MSIRTTIFTILLGSLMLQTAVAAKRTPLLTSPVAEVFGNAPSIVQPKLSPDGSRLLYLASGSSGVLAAYIRDLDSDAVASPVPEDLQDGSDIAWCEWASETRLLCQRVQRQGERFRNERFRNDIFAINVDGSDPIQYLNICSDVTGFRQGPAIDWLPEDPEHVMTMCVRSLGSDEVDDATVTEEEDDSAEEELEGAEALTAFEPREGMLTFSTAKLVDIYTGVEKDAPGATGGLIALAYLDGRGKVRVYDSGDAWYARIGSREQFDKVFEYRDSQFDDLLNYRPRLRFVGFGPNEYELFGVVEHRGSSLMVGINLSPPTTVRDVLSFTTGTVPRAITLGKYDRVAAVVHYDHGEQIRVVDERVASVHEAASKLLPDRDLEIVDESWDQRYYLILVDREQVTARYVRFEPDSGTVDELGSVYDIAGLAEPTETVTVESGAFHGQQLFARMTLPANHSGPAPAVIFVPWIQQVQATAKAWPAQFDHRAMNQFLATRGYVAMELLDFVELKGHPLFDLHDTSDLLMDARDFLVSEGYSESDRVCALSWGPVAVASTLKYPDLFDCVVVIGGTIDPRETDEVEYTLTEFLPYGVEAKTPPILMFVGDTQDRIGSLDISLLDRGRGKGLDQAKDVEPIEYDDIDTFIRYGPNRVDMLTRIDQFLNAHIGQ